MLEKLVIGWEEIEPVFIVNIALNKPFILLGRHGTCKTTCAKEISKIYGEKAFRFYDATKDDLVSIAGIPIPQKLAQGKLEFSEHNRSIWKAKVIVIDELTRANKENQNLWLEILEEKACFGKKLCYETLIATMNPESYAATFKLDEALLDRFYAVIPVPDLQKGTNSKVFKKVIELNLNEQALDQNQIAEFVASLRKTYKDLLKNKIITNAIIEYVSNYIEILLNKVENYISPRKAIHLVEEILGLASYYKVQGFNEYLCEGAKKALLYVLGIPLKIKPEILFQIHSSLKQILLKTKIEPAEKIRIQLAKLTDNDSAIQYLRRNLNRIKYLPFDEVEKFLMELAEKSKNNNLLTLNNLLNHIEGHEEVKRIVQGRILFYEIDAISEIIKEINRKVIANDDDLIMFNKARSFLKTLKQLPLDEKTERLLFKKNFEKRILEFIKKGGFDGNKTEISSGMQWSGVKSSGDF
ncbi:MAG: MoxR family ATPase [candidate division WOR-3 bacterium]